MNIITPQITSRELRPSLYQTRGFTLIEVITVVFIVGVIISFASLSVSTNEDQRVRDEAERIQHLLNLASEEAILHGRELAMQISQKGYLFVELDLEGKWVPIANDKLFRQREFPDLFDIELHMWGKKMNMEEEDKFQNIKTLSSGEMDPFILWLKKEDGEAYAIKGNLVGQTAIYPPGEDPESDS
jgi:general secretion pathway protein H